MLSADELIERELQLIKINAAPAQRSEILTLCDLMGAKVIDLTATSMTIEISDSTEVLQRFHSLIEGYGIKEIVRTGTIAIQKGAVTIR